MDECPSQEQLRGIRYFGTRAIFLFGFCAVCIWLIVFLLSFYVGLHMLKKEPPLPLWPRHVDYSPDN